MSPNACRAANGPFLTAVQKQSGAVGSEQANQRYESEVRPTLEQRPADLVEALDGFGDQLTTIADNDDRADESWIRP